MIVCCSVSTVCSVEKRTLKRALSSPGMTFGAPVPALMFETWKLVGGKYSLPLSQTRAASSASAGATRVHRVVGEVRIGDVTLDAVHGELARERAAPADLDRVAERVGAAGLADHAPVDLLAARFERFHHAPRAVDRRAFLVARQQERERAAVIGMRGDKALAGGHHRRESTLHVGGAAAVQDAVAHDRVERIGLPFFARAGRHDVGVTGEAQHGSGSAMPRPDVLDRAEGHPLDPKTERFQPLPDQLQAAVVLGADGRTADQFLGECERRVGVGRQSRGLRIGQGEGGRGLIAKTSGAGKPPRAPGSVTPV